MANRFPLVIDTGDGNKIKELPAGDNLNLRENNIVNVQDINALGTINAAVVTVNGEKLVAQNFADLSDTPSSYAGSEDYFVKVNEDGTGLEFRPITDIGNIDLDTVTVTEDILPAVTNTGSVGTDVQKFQRVTANELKGSLLTFNGQTVFDAETGKITYAALQGAPSNLSEFTDDIGFLRTSDLDDSLSSLFGDGATFTTDIQGSVFGDDSTMIIDGVAGVVTGDILNTTVDTAQLTATQITSTAVTAQLFEGPAAGDMQIDAGASGIINLGTGASTTAVNIDNAVIETINNGSGVGVPNITSPTDITITAGNRIKLGGNVPLKFSTTTDADRVIITPQVGDTIYNTDENRLQVYQNGEWISLHKGEFTGNVTTDAGESNFNDIVVAGNLTVQGTTTTVDTDNTTIKDNTIVLNNGEVGAGVTAGTSGIEIDRGSEDNKTLVWDETDDKWTVGSETFAANTFEAVGFQGAFFGNGGLNSPLQLSSGLEGQTGNTIFINPQGSDTLVQMWGETVNLVTGPYNTYDSPYMQFKTAGAFKAHQGAYFDGDLVGNVIGDVVGSVFGDDSTTLVDSVAGKVTGDVVNTEVVTTTVQGRDSEALNIYRGISGTVSLGDASSGDVSVSDSGINITSTGGVNVNGAVGATVDIGTGATTGNVTIGKAGNTTTIDGTFNATLTGDVDGNVTGNVTGNIDNTELTIGAANATSIVIGNPSSTVEINGTIEFADALIAENITADDSITIGTNGNTANEAINIAPQGDNNAINLISDNIRFFGSVTNEVTFTGGIIGDLKGSLVADDSTVIVDGVSGTIYKSNIEDSSNWDTAFGWGDHSTQGYLQDGGSFTGDVKGSIFADDSSIMVNAVDFTITADVMTLTPLNAEPTGPIDGMIAIADGVSWDPLATGVKTMMVYLDSAWRQIASAA